MALTRDGLSSLWNELVKDGEVVTGFQDGLVNSAGVWARKGELTWKIIKNLSAGRDFICRDLIGNLQWHHRITGFQRNLVKRHIFVTSTVPADGLALSGAKASAGTVMAKFWSWIIMGPALGVGGWTLYMLNCFTLLIPEQNRKHFQVKRWRVKVTWVIYS